MHSLKLLSFFLLALLVQPLMSQDDDFFLQGEEDEEEAVRESTEFSEDNADFLDDIVKFAAGEDLRVLEYAPIAPNDIIWQRRIWRVLDLREKMNQPFKNEDRPLFTILNDLAGNGDIKVFEDEKFKDAIGADDLARKMNRIDTTVVYDPDTYEEKIVITESPLNPEDINRFRVKEVWYFDKKHSVMKCRILGIAPIQDVFDEDTGEFKYALPLFWVYYPQARKYLAREMVPNDFNDVAPMRWDKLFEDRFFASYITKASNSLGLRLQDIHPDSEYDRLLESSLIEQDLFNFEHDLWTY